MKATLRIMAATALFGAAHSALASRAAKQAAAQVFGERNRNGLYRTFYIGQSVATFATLTWYVLRQPGRTLYKVPAPQSWAFRGAQAVCLGVSAIAAQRVGLRNITGIESFQQWRHSGSVKPEPEAQGPAHVDGTLDISGPFRFSRHPLNFWPMPIFWLNPRMTTNLLAFNVAATAYLFAGSAHEEARLRAAYGDKYIEYQNSGIPYYFPFKLPEETSCLLKQLASLIAMQR